MSELRHQFLSQLGHLTFGAAVSIPMVYGYHVGYKMLFIVGVGVLFGGIYFIVRREMDQFPSNRTSTGWWAKVGGWDPYLDGVFWITGLALPFLVIL